MASISWDDKSEITVSKCDVIKNSIGQSYTMSIKETNKENN